MSKFAFLPTRARISVGCVSPENLRARARFSIQPGIWIERGDRRSHNPPSVLVVNYNTKSPRPMPDFNGGQGLQSEGLTHSENASVLMYCGQGKYGLLLIASSAVPLRDCMQERKTVHLDDASSKVVVTETQIFDVREFLQPKDNGRNGNQEQWFCWRRF